ncbi:MAG: sodium:proton exchanger [Actinobacteria bacterium]|nr:MAG: sodium:proton exchanger [Actinomycetota bacterium]
MHNEIIMIALVLAAAAAGGKLASRFGYPTILGELIAGILLGPPLLGLISGNEALEILGEFGVLLMMLYIGMHLQLRDLRRASMPGLMAAFGGFIVPTALGIVLMLWFDRTLLEAIFVGLAMGVTSLATKSRILVDLKILDTRIAHVLVAAALISDVAVLVAFASIIGPGTEGGISLATAGIAGIKAIGFGFVALIIGRWGLPRLSRLPGIADPDRGRALLAVIAFGLTMAWAAELAGIHAILGAFVAGLFIDTGVMTAKASREVQQRLATVSVGTLAPVFFVTAGFEVSLGVFQTDLLLLVLVIVVATVAKVVGTALFYLPTGLGWREGIVLGTGMNGRGAVEIIVAEIALAQGIIDTEVFSILVFMAIFTTATVPVLLTIGVNWLRRRGELVRAGDRTNTVIVGAGPIARTFAKLLAETTPVVLIDPNRANQRAAAKDGLRVISGSGFEEATLMEAGVDQAARLIAATPNAEANLLSVQLASELGVPEVVSLLRESDLKTFEGQLRGSGIEVIHAPESLADWEHAIATGGATVTRFRVNPEPGEENGLVAGESFPIVVVGSNDTFPLTTGVSLADTDQVIVLTRKDSPHVEPTVARPA